MPTYLPRTDLLVFRYTKFRGTDRDGNPVRLTKQLSLVDGALRKDAPRNAGSGTIAHVASTLSGFADDITKMPQDTCLVHGVTDITYGRVTPAGYPRPGYISRTKKYFSYPAGQALLMLDHDTDPQRGGMTPDELLAVLIGIHPMFGEAGRVVAYSTSSFVYDENGTLLSAGKPGFHLYFVGADGRDIERFGEVLGKRLWLVGYGFGRLSASGSFMVRSVIDGAVFSPERCDFVAPPVLLDGLIQKRSMPQYRPGGVLDTHLLPDLTAAEEDDYDRLVAAERARLKPEQEPKRRAFAARRAAAEGTTPDDEYKRLVAADKGVISENARLGLKGETLKELIRAGRHRTYVIDPQEPDEDTRALLFIDGPGDAKVCSFRHGRVWFQVVSEETVAAVADAPDTEDKGDGLPVWLASRFAALTEISEPVKRRHRHRRVVPDQIGDTLHDGVFLLRMGCGAGKTQRYGRPLAEHARQQGESFVAMCHRISLTAELANRLGCTNYQAKDAAALVQSKSLAICVNSIITAEFNLFCRGAQHVFIDEVSQVLRHIATGSVKDAQRSEIFETLKALIANAETVVVADADCNDMVVEFLEQCRPGEAFNILEAELDHGHLSVTWEYGQPAFDKLCGDVLTRLADGQKLIVASDSLTKLKVLHSLAAAELPDKSVLIIHKDLNGEAEQQAFMQDPNGECVKYDLVLHSPSMSSGVSIEVEHFDHGYGLFFGCIIPSDAHQMMRRARRLRSWHLAFIPNNGQRGMTNAADIEDGLRAAARLDGCEGRLSSLDALVVQVKADEATGQGNFAVVLVAYLRRLGFQVAMKAPDSNSDIGEDDLAEIKREISEQMIADILGARVLNDIQAENLRRLPGACVADRLAVSRWSICRGLNVAPEALAADDIRFWDGGRGLRRLRRYELATGRALIAAEHEQNLSLRKFDRLKSELYAYLLEPLGLDLLTGGGEFSQVQAEVVVDRVVARPSLFAALRLIPGTIGRARPKDGVKLVQRVLELMGLRTVSRRHRVAGELLRSYHLNPEFLGLMTAAAERRKVPQVFQIAHSVSTGNGQSGTAPPLPSDTPEAFQISFAKARRFFAEMDARRNRPNPLVVAFCDELQRRYG